MAERFTVEPGVPVPDGAGQGGRQRGESMYPFGQMALNESFTARRSANTLETAARRWRRSSGHLDWRFVVRTLGDGRVRCWRVR